MSYLEMDSSHESISTGSEGCSLDDIQNLSIFEQLSGIANRCIHRIRRVFNPMDLTDDSEYIHLKQEFMELLLYMKTAIKSIRNYGKSLKGVVLAARVHFGEILGTMQFLEDFGAELVDDHLNTIIESIQAKLDEMQQVKVYLKVRDTLKLDFDAALFKYRRAIQRGRRGHIEKKIVEVELADDRLKNADRVAMELLVRFQAEHPSIIAEEIVQLEKCLFQYYETSARSLMECLEHVSRGANETRLESDQQHCKNQVVKKKKNRVKKPVKKTATKRRV